MRPLPPNRFSRRAFTLPEILGVMAIFALTAAIVAANYDALPAAFGHPSPENAIRRAFTSARSLATNSHGPVTLSLADNTVKIIDASGSPVGETVLLPKDDPREAALIADDGTNPADAPAWPSVRFTAEGAVNPVRFRLLDKNSGKLRVWRADALSAVLAEETPAP